MTFHEPSQRVCIMKSPSRNTHMTITGFTKTLRSLDQSSARAAFWWLAAAILVFTALGAWLTLGRVQLDEISDEARIEIDGSAFVVQAPMTGRIVRVNFALGQPVAAGAVLIEIDSGRPATSPVVDQIVVSVGPYMFVTWRTPAASSSAASEAGKASPPIIHVKSLTFIKV